MPRLAAVLTASALLLAACGDDVEEKNDYVDALNAAQERYAEKATDLGTDPAKYDEQVRELTQSTDELIDEIEALDPPDEVQEQHDDIIAALKEFNSTVKPVLDDLGSDDPAVAGTAVQSLAAASTKFGTQFDQEINEINDELHD